MRTVPVVRREEGAVRREEKVTKKVYKCYGLLVGPRCIKVHLARYEQEKFKHHVFQAENYITEK